MTSWALACRLLLAGAFLLAGASKIRRASMVFVRVRRGLNLPAPLARSIARWLAPFELTLGALLAVGLGLQVLGLVVVATMAGFGVFLLVGRARDPEFDCGCFGSDHGAVTWVSIARNVSMAAAGALVFFAGEQPLSLDDLLGSAAPEAMPASEGLAIGAAATAVLVGVLLVSEAMRSRRSEELLRHGVWAEAMG